jgi:hypothetical protein
MIKENFEEAKKVVSDLKVVSFILDDLKRDCPVGFSNHSDIETDVFKEDLKDFLTEEQKKLKSIFSRL